MQKTGLHPRNIHAADYDFELLTSIQPALKQYLVQTPQGKTSLSFAQPAAVKLLNQALLKAHYDLPHWDLPPDALCPPIPSRVDYLHYIADLLASNNGNKIPKGRQVLGLDIGVGANCIYPLLGHQVYAWQFIGSEVQANALKAAQKVVNAHPKVAPAIDLRLQSNTHQLLHDIVQQQERLDFTVCNPPFYESAQAAKTANNRKLRGLNKKAAHSKQPKASKLGAEQRNFGGQAHELWCEGGERKFIQRLLDESKDFKHQCCWFSSLVAQSKHLEALEQRAHYLGAQSIKIISMQHGNKTAHILAWSFLDRQQQQLWAKMRW